MLSHWQINFSPGFWIFLPLAILAAVLSFYFYRQTLPPLTPFQRYTLATLRALAFILILLMMFQPVMSLTYDQTHPPVVAVLLDNSQSMNIHDRTGSRSQQEKEIFSDHQWGSLPGVQSFFSFSDKLVELTRHDSLAFTGPVTNIQKALQQCEKTLVEKNLKAIVLVSDGQNSLGDDPVRFVESGGIPIYTIGIGDTTEPSDIQITHVKTNEIVYAESVVPVEVTIQNRGFIGEKTFVQLQQNGKIIDSQPVSFSGAVAEQTVHLKFIPKQEGMLNLQLEAAPLPHEFTTQNNLKKLFIKVLKSKIRVLMVGGSPSPDFSFAKRILEKDPNLQSTFLLQKNETGWLQGTRGDWNQDFDAILFIGYPTERSDREVLNQIIQRAEDQSVSLAVFSSPQIDWNRSEPFHNWLPMQINRLDPSESQAVVNVNSSGNIHALFHTAENPLENTAFWQDLPPIFIRNDGIQMNANSQLMSTAAIGGKNPLIKPAMFIALQGNSKKQNGNQPGSNSLQKKFISFVYGLWHWDFLLAGARDPRRPYEKFLANTVRWLSTQEDRKLVRLTFDQRIYKLGEPVNLDAQVYDASYRPILNAEVSLKLSNGSELKLSPVGDGHYTGSIESLAEGEFTYTVEASENGQSLGTDRGSFAVVSQGLEFVHTKMDQVLLEQLSSVSGGIFFTYKNRQEIFSHLRFSPKITSTKKTIDLWTSTWLFIPIITLFSAEWWIRKRRGLL